jgi:isocitrate lyase
MMRKFFNAGVEEVNGFKIYAVSDEEYAAADAWLDKSGVTAAIEQAVAAFTGGEIAASEAALDRAANAFIAEWSTAAGLKTLGQAIVDAIAFRQEEGVEIAISIDEWLDFASKNGFHNVRAKARELGIDVVWDAELARTPEGYYQVQGGIPYAVAKSLAAAPFADLLWMETKTADLEDAREFAEAIHAVYPDQMLAYNLSPSFNWDTTGMNDDEMRQFPKELGKMGFVFNFMTYAGHQIDGLAAEEFTEALQADGMLALARLQRKLRLLESPYRTPQTLVGGPRADAGLSAAWGQTATTKAMGEGSTQKQHLVQTEVPTKVLGGWLGEWSAIHGMEKDLRVQLRPHTAGTDTLELSVLDGDAHKLANVVFAQLQDRRGNTILSVRDQNTFDQSLRRKRLATLMHLFLIHRYQASAIHYLTPTEDNHRQSESLKKRGIFSSTTDEVGEIIVAEINDEFVSKLVAADSTERAALIAG